MRISTLEFHRQAVRAMQDSESRLSRTELQLATGRAILQPSDDPAGTKRILDLDQVVASQAQFQRNAAVALSRLSLEESTLGSVGDALVRARELALQGANATLGAGDRKALAVEVRARLEDVLALANVQDGEGDYLFAGYQAQTRPFERDAGGAYVYAGDTHERRVQVGSGQLLVTADSGHEVFVAIASGNGTFATREAPGNQGTGVIEAGSVTGPVAYTGETYTVTFTSPSTYDVVGSDSGTVVTGAAFEPGAAVTLPGLRVAIQGAPAAGDSFTVEPSREQDLFTTLEGLAEALEGAATAGTGFQNAIGRALTDLDRGLDRILQVRAGVGARLNVAETQQALAEDFELHARESLSDIEDLDYAEASGRLQLQLLALQASQQAFVKIRGLSLFNYL
jgi:flagellar hook-associated protein 3 FlgL